MSHPTPKSAVLSTISGLSWGGVYGGHKSCSRDDFYVFVCVVSDRGVAPRIFPPSAGRLGEAEFGDSFRN